MSFHTGIGIRSKLRAGANRPAPADDAETSELKYSHRAPKLTVRRFSVHASWAKMPRSAFKRSVQSSGVFRISTELGTPFMYRCTRSALATRVRRYGPQFHCAPVFTLCDPVTYDIDPCRL